MPTVTLTIDPEFAGLCPALTVEERSLLEASLERDGCRDALIVWANHDDTILDGHNRYEICKSLRIKFVTKALVFETRHEARNWVIANQLGRRNATEEQKSYLRGQRYLGEKKEQGGDRKSSGNSYHLKTAERIAEETGVSEKTIRNDAKFAEAVDTAHAKAGKPLRDKILSGEFPKIDVMEVAALPAEEIEPELERRKASRKQGETRVRSQFESLIEKTERLIEVVDRMAAERLGATAKSTAVVDHLRAAIKAANAWRRSVEK